MGKVRHYKTDAINVIWDPDKCIHSGECVKGSPSVFHPNEKPWITLDGADAETVRKTIDKCPTGALSYEGRTADDNQSARVRVKTVKDGPLLFSCDLEIEDSEGTITRPESVKTVALCRCGSSSNKPYCDGSHREVGFKS